jgi:hypothetical protein
VQEIFETNKSEKLRGVIVWISMLDTDKLEAASERETKFSDPRVKQFWDQDQIFGQLLSQTLKLKESIAWDVYLVYPPGHSWDTEFPPLPTFGMHQLNEDPTRFLDPSRYKEYVQTVLERTAFQ